LESLEIKKKVKDLYNSIKESKDQLNGTYFVVSDTIFAIFGNNKDLDILLSEILVNKPELIEVFEKAILTARICIKLKL
jgi:hypothetical protein